MDKLEELEILGRMQEGRVESVAIIGGGASGTLLTSQLAPRSHAPKVTLIDRGGRPGRGLAYSTNDAKHVLNVRASRMSAHPDKLDDFKRWLCARGIDGDDPFASRYLYGDYLEGVLAAAIEGRGDRVVRIQDEAVACRRVGKCWRVALSGGADVEADAVVLALGHQPARTPEVMRRAGIGVIDGWDSASLAAIAATDDVLILGAGLTMIDAVLTLSSRPREGVIYALSRRGLLPRPHLDVALHGSLESLQQLPESLSEALRVWRAETARMAARGEPWQLLFDRIRRDTPHLWRRLLPETQARFLRHLRPWWDAHRHRAAPSVHARIATLVASGKLRVLAGELTAAEATKAGARLLYRARGGDAIGRVEIAHVVNCTGADNDLARAQSALVQQMLRENLIRPHSTGLGLDVDDEGRVQGEAREGLFAIGPVTQGAYWESTAIPEIRLRAAALAERLCLR